MKKLAYASMLAVAVAIVSGAAGAQIGRSNAPIEITSDRQEILQNEGLVLFLGNVVATQADSRITTSKLTATCQRSAPTAGQSLADQPCEELRQMVAEGDVLYTAPEVKIRGDRAEYDYPTDTITITGEVIMSRGTEAVVRGTKVVYQVGKGLTTITSDENRVLFITSPAKAKDEPSATFPTSPTTRPN